MAREVALEVDILGLIDIFGDALYEDFGSIVRELVQNAHDAILESKLYSDDNISIENSIISCKFNYTLEKLSVSDNGIGMSVSDIETNLNNFATSKKRDKQKDYKIAKEKLFNEEDLALSNIIGEYGVGFLSIMSASDLVVVHSRKNGCEPVRWTYRKKQTKAKLETIDDAQFEEAFSGIKEVPPKTGTILQAKLSAELFKKYYIDDDDARGALIRYAALLPVPITYNGEKITGKHLAWNDPATASKDDWEEMIKEVYKDDPLLIIPVFSSAKELDLQGVLWVPERYKFYVDAKIDLYVKRMFVLEGQDIINPSWARFIRGAVNSNRMRRIVSGNNVKNDQEAKKVKEFLSEKIIESFRGIRSLDDHEYHRIIGPHDEQIKGSAAEYEEFKKSVWDKLRIPSKSRKLTIPSYLKSVKNVTGQSDVIYYYDKPERKFQSDLISDSTGIPILDLSQTRDWRFVKSVADDNGWSLLPDRDLAQSQFAKVDLEGDWDSLISACAVSNIEAEVRAFEPEYVPAVLIQDDKLKDKRDALLEGLKTHGEEHIAKELEKIARGRGAANFGISFYLNSSCSLIKEMAKSDYEIQVRLCLALYNISFMTIIPDLKSHEINQVYSSINKAFSQLLRDREMLERMNDDKRGEKDTREGLVEEKKEIEDAAVKHLVVFVMTPYEEEYKKLEEEVRKVFECAPFFFEVVLARDYVLEGGISHNVDAHISQADAYVAEISDLNPNVMMELGAAIYAKEKKPILTLRKDVSEKNIPSDIRDKIHLHYDSTHEVEKKMKEFLRKDGRNRHKDIFQLLDRPRKRYLSKTYLDSLPVNLTQNQATKLMKRCVTLEDVVEYEAKDLAKEIDISLALMAAIVEEVKASLSESAN